jgi:hypothetical protein
MVESLASTVKGLVFYEMEAVDLWFMVYDVGLAVCDFQLRVQGSGFRV